ncbi:hypothetical protein ASG88_03315 [Nocardioides sp. Soil777]|uniref:hypothetical protein n=1 Tax=Nocardioides sp. Soil777 TaxID=1736409 RepID=UPI00070355D4|nr:hypothetical protein [Nocardioides sp. Soil777]KRF07844.1 hypothetical protein ASG88_03315 [Nocardioides sp. Soil777]
MRTSTIYTIGTALTRAQGSDVSVDVLVAGSWLHGHVSAVDGHGLVLHGDDDVLSILRMDSISAVQVKQAGVFEAHGEVEAPTHATVHPMPASGGEPHWAQPEAAWGRRHQPVADEPLTPYDGGPIVVPGPRAATSAPRPVARPTVGPIVAPSAVPDSGLHTMLRSCREALAEEAPAS